MQDSVVSRHGYLSAVFWVEDVKGMVPCYAPGQSVQDVVTIPFDDLKGEGRNLQNLCDSNIKSPLCAGIAVVKSHIEPFHSPFWV